MDVWRCELGGPDAGLLPIMAVITAGAAEQQGGLRARPAERELAVRRMADPGMEVGLLGAGDPADPDGVCELGLEMASNVHVAHIDLWVPVDRRRRGIGSALLAAAEERARAAGRALGMAQVDSPAPSGRAFFEARGYDAALVLVCNRLRVGDLDRSLLDAWTADPDPAYELVLIDGPPADHQVAPLVEAVAAMNDAPVDALEVDDEVFTAERLLAHETRVVATGERRLTYLAVHAATGAGAGFTAVRWDPEQPSVVWQRGTAVAAPHRGHGLGRRLKAAMLLHLLAEVDGIAEVRTENAATNAHMIAINAALGFAPWAEQVVLQKRL